MGAEVEEKGGKSFISQSKSKSKSKPEQPHGMRHYNKGPAILPWSYVLVIVYSPLLSSWVHLGHYIYIFDIYIFLLVLVTSIVILKCQSFNALPASVFFTLAGLIGVGVLSIAFSPFFEITMFFSVFQYVRLLVILLIWINLNKLGVKPDDFITPLFVVSMFETAVAFYQVVSSVGALRGMGLGTGRGIYEFQIWIILYLFSRYGLRSRALANFGIVFFLLGVFATLTRTAWLELFIVLILWALVNGHSLLGRLKTVTGSAVAATVFGISLVFGADLWQQASARIQQISEFSGTIMVRLFLWRAALTAFLAYPVLGIGSGAFSRNLGTLLQQSGLELPSTYLTLTMHNQALEILTENGIIGFAFYILFVASVFTMVITKLRTASVGMKPTGVLTLALFLSDFFGQSIFTRFGAFFLGWTLFYIKFEGDTHARTISSNS